MVRKRRVNKGEPEKPWMPTTIVPQSLGRKVLLKIGNRFLRVGNDVKPAISKVKPPLTPPSGVCKWDLLSDRRGPGPPKRPKPHPGYFNFRDFTFLVDETASDTASWFRSMRSYFHVRIGVQREGASGPTEFLSPVERDLPRVQYDRTADRCWWRVTAVGRGRFLVQSVQPEGLTLMDGPFGLTLGPALTAQEWAGVTKGRLNTARTLSIIPLSDFVHGGVTVN